MAEHKHGDMDITTHEKVFDGFMKWTVWSSAAIIVLLVLMAIFIS
ncbi:MAG: aa3-type cytochrome c oxidase subunit IV [Pseudomonadota bacterium]